MTVIAGVTVSLDSGMNTDVKEGVLRQLAELNIPDPAVTDAFFVASVLLPGTRMHVSWQERKTPANFPEHMPFVGKADSWRHRYAFSALSRMIGLTERSGSKKYRLVVEFVGKAVAYDDAAAPTPTQENDGSHHKRGEQ